MSKKETIKFVVQLIACIGDTDGTGRHIVRWRVKLKAPMLTHQGFLIAL